MKKIPLILIAVLFGFSASLSAQSPLEKLQDQYMKRREALSLERELEDVKLRKSYHGALEKLMEQVRAGGDFPYFMDVEKELKRTASRLSSPDVVSPREELAHLQGILQAQLEELDSASAKKLVTLHGQMDQALVQLQQARLREGNVDAAKEIENLRRQTREEPEVAAAYAMRVVTPQSLPPAAAGGGTGNILELQKLFAGKITAYNAVTREMEITYDFSNRDQLKDFKFKPSKYFKIEEGQLVVTAPAGSDWWVTRPELNSPTMLIPFVEPDDFEMKIEMLSVKESTQYHFALGLSDLKNRTIGFGAFGGSKSFTVQGWTPADPQLKLPVVAQKYPTILSMLRKGNEVEFGVKIGAKTEKTTVEADGSLLYPGLFPKSWEKSEAVAQFDNLTIKGKLNRDGIQ